MTTDTIAPDCVRVDIACNDPTTGTRTFQAMGLTIGRGDLLIELEATGRGLPIGISPGCLRIGRQAFAVRGEAHWVGSMAWDGFWMTVEEAARLLLWAHAKQWFAIQAAESTLFAMWKRTDRFAGDHLIEQLTIAGREQQGLA